MNAPNPFRCTFLRSYWRREYDRFDQSYLGLSGDPLSGKSEAFFLDTLALNLKVHERDRGTSDSVYLESLVKRGKRIVLFDQVGAGKRTMARKVFLSSLRIEAGEPEFLPCWLPRLGNYPDYQPDLLKLIWREAFDTFPSGSDHHWRRLLESWLCSGPPLLLFVELDRFPNQGHILDQLVSFLTSPEGRATCCIVINHSNLGGLAKRWQGKGFALYEVQRIDRNLEMEYAFKLQNAGVSVVRPTELAQDLCERRSDSDRRMLPQLLHLLSATPLSPWTPTNADIFNADIFKVVEEHVLLQEQNQVALLAEYRNSTSWLKTMREALGLIALAILDVREDAATRNLEGEALTRTWNTVRHLLPQSDPEPATFFLVHEGERVRFVNSAFLAYFAAVGGMRNHCHIPDEVSDDLSWCDKVVHLLVGWPQLSPLVAEFLAGDLGLEQLSQLLLTALAWNVETDRAAERLVRSIQAERLGRSIQGLCQGANPSFQVFQALLAGNGDGEWWSLEDPDLLRGELHSLLVNKASASDSPLKEELTDFTNRLQEHLAARCQPWLERCWPKITDLVPSVEHEDRVTALVVIPPWVVSGDRSGELVVWDWKQPPPKRFQQHNGQVRALVGFEYRDLQWIASAGNDGMVRLLALKQGEWQTQTQPRAHAGKVFALAVLRQGDQQHILSAGEEGLLYDWLPWESAEQVRVYSGHRGSIRFLCELPFPSRYCAASAGDDGRVRLWEFGIKNRIQCCPIPLRAAKQPAPVTALVGDSYSLVWGDDLGQVFHIHTTPGAPLRERRDHTRAVTALRITGDEIISAGADGRVVRWNWPQNSPPNPGYTVEDTPVFGLDLIDNTPIYATGDGTVRLLGPPENGQCDEHPGSVRLLKAFPGDGAQQFVTAGERLVRIGKLGQTPSCHSRHRGRVTSLAGGPDFFVSGGSEGSVMIFEAAGAAGWQRRYHWPTLHEGPVTFLQVCASLIVTAGRDGKVCVWRWGKNMLELLDMWRGAPVTALWVEGNSIVWATEDGYVCWSQPNVAVVPWRVSRDVTALAVCRRQGNENLDFVAANSRNEVFHLQGGPKHTEQSLLTSVRGRILALRWLGLERVVVATADHVEVHSVQGSNSSPFIQDTRRLSALACSSDGRWLAWGTASGEVSAVDGQGQTPPYSQNVHTQRVTALQFDQEDKDVFLSASNDAKVKFSRLGRAGLQILGGCPVGGPVSVMALTGREVFTGLVDGRVAALQLHLPRSTSN